jgi:hypothetical protein
MDQESQQLCDQLGSREIALDEKIAQRQLGLDSDRAGEPFRSQLRCLRHRRLALEHRKGVRADCRLFTLEATHLELPTLHAPGLDLLPLFGNPSRVDDRCHDEAFIRPKRRSGKAVPGEVVRWHHRQPLW